MVALTEQGRHVVQFAITGLQLPCTEGQRGANFDTARRALKCVPKPSVTEFVVLPELFAIGFRHEDFHRAGPGVPGPATEFITRLAEDRGAYVVGTDIEQAGNRFYNTLVMASPTGDVVGHYRKVHPFQEERDVFLPGTHPVLFDLPGVRTGVLICYDIRFPEVARALALAGAELLIVPAAFPDPRAHHWDTLVTARAIENQLYVAAVNRVGLGFDGKTYFGHSQVVDPWGQRLNRLTSEPGMVTVLCDTSVVEAARSAITCFEDRLPHYPDPIIVRP